MMGESPLSRLALYGSNKRSGPSLVGRLDAAVGVAVVLAEGDAPAVVLGDFVGQQADAALAELVLRIGQGVVVFHRGHDARARQPQLVRQRLRAGLAADGQRRRAGGRIGSKRLGSAGGALAGGEGVRLGRGPAAGVGVETVRARRAAVPRRARRRTARRGGGGGGKAPQRRRSSGRKAATPPAGGGAEQRGTRERRESHRSTG